MKILSNQINILKALILTG